MEVIVAGFWCDEDRVEVGGLNCFVEGCVVWSIVEGREDRGSSWRYCQLEVADTGSALRPSPFV